MFNDSPKKMNTSKGFMKVRRRDAKIKLVYSRVKKEGNKI